MSVFGRRLPCERLGSPFSAVSFSGCRAVCVFVDTVLGCDRHADGVVTRAIPRYTTSLIMAGVCVCVFVCVCGQI